MRKLILILAVLLIPAAAMAQTDRVLFDLASDHVDITTGFNGTSMQVFGVRKAKGDIVVVVRGPERTMSVRRKESVLGAWINRSFETYKDVPSYYNYAASGPIETIAEDRLLKEYGIGPNNLQFNKANSTDEKRILFREAMIRNKIKQGLYPEKPLEIKFISPDFFRADFYIPANVPVGEYKVETMYFENGALRDSKTRTVRVAQVGGSAKIHTYAHDNSLLYGVFCVLLAIFAGWFSNRVRRGR
jgi:uncharacterized protein (TIGR02186 family)